MGKVIGGKFSEKAELDARREKNSIKAAQREQERNPINEKPYGGLLNKLGRMACRKVFFEKITLEKMVFPKIGNIKDVSKTKNFINGYNSEMNRIKNALNNNYLDAVEKDYFEDIAIEKEYKNNKIR